jgi:hypothetical protein
MTNLQLRTGHNFLFAQTDGLPFKQFTCSTNLRHCVLNSTQTPHLGINENYEGLSF